MMRFPLAVMVWYLFTANDEPEKAITAFNTFLQKYKTEDTFAKNRLI